VNHEKRVQRTAKAVAEVLKELREERGLSMNRLAQQAGLAQQTIAFIENGDRRPTLDSLIRLCSTLGVPLSALFQEAESRLKNGSR
jgi:transcriptional regulator with XRE-family HTH domain